MIVLLLIFILGALCAGLAYWIDARGHTKAYGNAVIVLWLVVCACVVLLLSFAVVLFAVWSGHWMSGALR